MDITSFLIANRNKAFLVGDYRSYRSQLSRQLHTLRRKLVHTPSKDNKYVAPEPITAGNISDSHEFVHLILLTAERPWSHAMQMKSAHAEENTSHRITGPTRRHIISRLHKAAKIAEKLVALLDDRVSTRASDTDVLEAKAYALYLSGVEEFEKHTNQSHEDSAAASAAWLKCLTFFSEAYVIYTALLHYTRKDVFKEVLSSTIEPSIRYAAYQSRLSRTIAISTVTKQHFRRSQSDLLQSIQAIDPNALQEEKTVEATNEGKTIAADVPTSITWRGRTASIVDASIGQALAATSVAASQLRTFLSSTNTTAAPTCKSLAAAYDPVLTAAQEAVDATRSALSELSKEGVPESDLRMQNLRVSDLATNYTLISWRIGRNRILMSSSPSTLDDGMTFHPEAPRPRKHAPKSSKESAAKAESKGHQLARLRERVALYDATLQSIDSITDLPGASRDTAFMDEVARQRAYFRALRCLNIGYSHSLLERHANALALFARAADLLASPPAVGDADGDAETRDGAALETSTLDVSAAQFTALAQYTAVLTTRQRGLVALHQSAADAVAAASTHAGEWVAPVVERLHEFPASGKVDLNNLVEWPPRLRPVPVKPIFLDLAWNYIAYPGAEPAKAGVEGVVGKADGVVQAAEEKTEKRKGWFGFGR